MKGAERENLHELAEPARSRIAPYAKACLEAERQFLMSQKVLLDMLALTRPEYAADDSGVHFDAKTLTFYRLHSPAQPDVPE